MKTSSRILVAVALLVGAFLLLLLTGEKEHQPVVGPKQMQPPPPQAKEEPLDHGSIGVRAKRVVPAAVGPDAQGMSFSGRVISRTTDAPVPDAELIFEHSGAAHSIKSGPDGAFRFEPVEAGAYRVAAVTAAGHLPFAPSWGESPLLITARAGKHVRDITIALEPTKEIDGKVTDRSGAPVAGARVTLLVPATEEMSAHAPALAHTSDASGRFRFEAAPGTLIEARHPDHLPAQALFNYGHWMRGSFTIELASTSDEVAPLRIAGRVVDAAGTGLPEVTVAAARDSSGPHDLAWKTRSGADGAFEFLGLAPGTYSLEASAPGQVPATEKEVAAGREDVVLRLHDAGGFIVGHVDAEPDGASVASFAVMVSEPLGRLEEASVRTESFLDAEGEFTIGPLEAKSYLVRAVAHGYAPSEPQSVRVSVGSRARADFVLSKGSRLIGVVRDGESKSGVAGARVTVEGRADGDGLPIPIEATALTNEEGHFELAGVAPGLRSVSASAKGYHIRIVSGLDLAREGTLGPIDILLTPLESADAEPKRELEGIGAALSADGDVLVIRNIIPNGGAFHAGLAAGDHIVRIDGQPVGDLDFNGVIQRIRGPVGTTVSLTIERDGNEQDVVVTRRKILD